ncbi:MAG: ABC transporter permease [Clostridiales Family XIII bacterium]|nr:ABC transporter permease [Clostridiales Family XIII bacterium]
MANRKIIRVLTRRSLRAGRLRNIVAVVAIALTAVLFTTVFALGGNMISAIQDATMRQVGTSAHGGLKYLTQAQYDDFAQSPLIKDISYNIIIGVAENEALKKKQTEIRYSEDDSAKWGFSYPTVGAMPNGRKELACSELTLDMLGIPHELGQTVPLEFSVRGEKYFEEFTLSGYWKGDPVMPAAQVWLSRAYTDSVAGMPTEVTDYSMDGIAGSINADLWFDGASGLEGKMEALIAERGYAPGEIRYGVNWAYMAGGTVDPTTAVVLAVAIVLILFSGYLIIYSVFAISVTRDIRFYGLLKTIGATGRQLRRIVLGQALAPALAGIPAGLVCGYLLGYVLSPFLLSMTAIGGPARASANPLIFVFAAAFSLLTILLSCRKPGRMAARVSPVEALRYTEPGLATRKARRAGKGVRRAELGKGTPLRMALANAGRHPRKLLIIVLSLSLSMILLTSIYSVVQGFDMEEYLKDQVVSDFSVADSSVYSALAANDNFEGVDANVRDGIAALPGLERSANIYFTDDTHTLSEQGRENFAAAMEALRPLLEGYRMDMAVQADAFLTEGVIPMHVYGVGEMAADILAREPLNPPIDFEKLASGDYVLSSRIARTDGEPGGPYVYGIGEKVPLKNAAGEVREFEVLAVLDHYDYTISAQHGHAIDSALVLADNVYLDFYGDKQPMMTIFDVTDGDIPAAEAWLASYCAEINPSLDYRSLSFYKAEFEGMKNTYRMIGGTLSVILALIGILNFVNTIVTSIFARRRELAVLQSVGMTGRQLKTMLLCEGVSYAVLTILFAATAGSGIGRLLVQAIAGEIWFFKWTFTITPLLAAIIPLLLICAAAPLVCYRFMRRVSIVDRLREE